ncbi:MAG: hypothetical protein ACREAO_10245 [Nitrososphaera sp.]|jgi:hypothetical protein
MESTLVQPTRLIEYPNDLSGCDALEIGQKNLLYLCSKSDGGMPFVVVLGFYAGQKEDFVTKDLIEPVEESNHHSVTEVLARSLAPQYSEAHIFFL